MITYPSRYPNTGRKTDWRDSAACREESADLFFPDGTTGPWLLVIEQAKAVCRRCPVREACLNFALEIGAHDGIFGGLTDHERGNHKRNTSRRERTTPRPTEPTEPAATLDEAFHQRSAPSQDGHRTWYGTAKFKWQGTEYNALHVAFHMTNGRQPEGPIRRSCSDRTCYEGAHLTDGRMRDEGAQCGTRPGYQRHRKRGEKACVPCRQANADADNRLCRTGTTKAAV